MTAMARQDLIYPFLFCIDQICGTKKNIETVSG